jgi:hypothetical protein
MKLLSTFVLLAALSVFVEAASFHDHTHRSNHNSISRRANTRRCRQRTVRIHRRSMISQVLIDVSSLRSMSTRAKTTVRTMCLRRMSLNQRRINQRRINQRTTRPRATLLLIPAVLSRLTITSVDLTVLPVSPSLPLPQDLRSILNLHRTGHQDHRS